MKLNYYSFAAKDIFIGVLVICRCSILCILLWYFNHTIIYLLPFALVIDWLLYNNSILSVTNSQLEELENAVNCLKKDNVGMGIIEDETIKEIDEEIRKYQLYQIGNRNGGKRTAVIRLNRMLGQFKSYTLYNAISVIFVPKSFDSKKLTNRTILAHEFAHCVSHDLLLVLKKQFHYSASILVLLVLFSSISIWIKIITVILAVLLVIIQVWPTAYSEIEANNKALEVIKTLYGQDAMTESAKCLLELRQTTLNKIRRQPDISVLSYAIEDLQIEFLRRAVDKNELIDQISPMNYWISFMNFALFTSSAYACYDLIQGVVISWYVMIGVPIILLIGKIKLIISNIKIWKRKNLIYEMIGIQ